VDLASNVPTGRGMGSSAATAVALVRALARAAGAELDAKTASALAFESEKVTHGSPSGIDNTVVALGRPIRFQRGSATEIAVGQLLTLLVADSGVPGPTRTMVAGVRERRDLRPAAYDAWFARIGGIAEESVAVLARGDVARLGRLMNANHLVLQAMRVSTPGLDRIVGAARLAGALGAKVSGAGGGGVAIALVTPATAAAVTEACLAAGAVQVLRTMIEATK
jgi:mevalonate kinase